MNQPRRQASPALMSGVCWRGISQRMSRSGAGTLGLLFAPAKAAEEVPDGQSRPARALPVAVEGRVELHEVEAAHRRTLAGRPRAGGDHAPGQSQRIGRADAWHVRLSDDIAVQSDTHRTPTR